MTDLKIKPANQIPKYEKEGLKNIAILRGGEGLDNVIFLDALASPGSIFWAYIGDIYGISRLYLRRILGIPWAYLGYV